MSKQNLMNLEEFVIKILKKEQDLELVKQLNNFKGPHTVQRFYSELVMDVEVNSLVHDEVAAEPEYLKREILKNDIDNLIVARLSSGEWKVSGRYNNLPRQTLEPEDIRKEALSILLNEITPFKKIRIENPPETSMHDKAKYFIENFCFSNTPSKNFTKDSIIYPFCIHRCAGDWATVRS